MSKLLTYIAILSVIIILFHLSGIITGTPLSFFADAVLRPESLRTNQFYTTVYGAILAILVGSSIVIGLFIPQRLDIIVLVPVAIMLFLVGWDLFVVYNTLRMINDALALVIFSPLMIIYILTVVEWWRGKD